MNIKRYLGQNPLQAVLGTAAVLLVGAVVFASIQSHCGKKHEQNAVIQGAVADTKHAELKPLQDKILVLEAQIKNREEAFYAINTKYQNLKGKALIQPLSEPPRTLPDLAKGLETIGFQYGVVVKNESFHLPSTLSKSDADVVWNLDQKAQSLARFQEALAACDATLTSSQALVEAQRAQIQAGGDALAVSMAEASARQKEAQELGKALTVERHKGWQKWMYGAAGVALTVLVKK